MNLVKNVDGTWDTAKLRVRQDLDTTQQTINAMLARLYALENPPAEPTPPPVISSANTVTVPSDTPLSVVATLPLGALKGDGRTSHAMGVKVDGTTITISTDNELQAVSSGTVHVAAAGALDGDGSSGSPLAVRVDASTVNIVGNQLVATSHVDAAGALSGNGTVGSPLAVKVDNTTVTIVGDQLVSSGSGIVFSITGASPTFSQTVPGTMTINPHPVIFTVTGVPGKTIVPMYLVTGMTQVKTGVANWTATVNMEAIWTGIALNVFSVSTNFASNGASFTQTALDRTNGALTDSTSATKFQGVDFVLRTSNVAGVTYTAGAGQSMVNTGTYSLIYALI